MSRPFLFTVWVWAQIGRIREGVDAFYLRYIPTDGTMISDRHSNIHPTACVLSNNLFTGFTPPVAGVETDGDPDTDNADPGTSGRLGPPGPRGPAPPPEATRSFNRLSRILRRREERYVGVMISSSPISSSPS